MSVCNYTQQISPNACVGDSLLTINSNFSALDEKLCSVPSVVGINGIKSDVVITEQGRVLETLATTNSLFYKTTFDSLEGVTEQTITLNDNIPIKVTSFPYSESTSGTRPAVTFTVAAPTGGVPKVTLYWLASGVDSTTVYATNSSISEDQKGPIWFNGPVTALHRVNNTLYVGGEFTSVGIYDSKKFATIALDAGLSNPTLSTIGELQGNPFSDAYGDLGTIGSVNSIVTTVVNSKSFIAIGGSYQSTAKGRGLTIVDTTSNLTYPFYVNGNVHVLRIVGDYLFVGGDFDYANYGTNSVSINSGLRVYSKGLLRIDLSYLAQLSPIPDISINQAFAQNINNMFSDYGIVNAIVSYNSVLYVGGQFQYKNGSSLVSQNLILMDNNGVRNSIWQPIVNGPVHALTVDDTTLQGGGVYLYAGGSFDKVQSSTQFNASPRNDTEDVTFYNAFAALLTLTGPQISTFWKPTFNGPVTSFSLHNNSPVTYIYCYGNFTTVNNEAVSYIAAITKASVGSSEVGKVNNWGVYLQAGPRPVNNAINTFNNSVIIGGCFTKVNSNIRYYLTRVNTYGDSLFASSLSSFMWDFNTQAIATGNPFNFTNLNSQTYRVSATPSVYGIVNATTFTANQEGLQNTNSNQLYRFYVRRPGNASALGNLSATNDTLKRSVDVVGYKVEFIKPV